jgi:hypothetical protein
MRQNIINQRSGAVRHPSRSTTRTETALLAAKRNQFLVMTGFALNPEKTMLKPSALQILIEFFCDVCWQKLAMAGQFGLMDVPILRHLFYDQMVADGRSGTRRINVGRQHLAA